MGYKLSLGGEAATMSRHVSANRMVLVSTFLICALIIALGVVLGLKIYRDDKQESNACTGNNEQSKATTEHPGMTTPRTITGSPVFVSSSKEGHYRYGAVASDAGPCATEGTNIMARRGGSAVDVAIATILCQCVYHFHSCGIGGGHFMTVYNRESRTAYAIMAREMAPAAANETMYVGEGASSTEGGLAIGIPGEIKGLWVAHQLGGKLPWRELFQPAIKMCRDGMVLGKSVAGAIDDKKDTILRFPGLKELLYKDATGTYYKEGEILKRPKLANTLETIANQGPDAFYNGSLSKDIVADIQDAGGIITEEDLANYIAVKKDPLVVKLNKNQTVYSPPPPSSGAVYQFIVNILDGYRLNNGSMSTRDGEILTWHRIIEAFKFAYGKRTHLGDSDAESQEFKDELQNLLINMTSESYADDTRAKIDDDHTHDTYYYGPTFYDQIKTGTSHLSVVAPNGDAVSITSTINLYFGSKVVGSRTGIIFNNEMDDFSTPNTVNSFGVPASPANFIKPYKRPLSSMCPSIVVDKDGMVNMVVGASGGTRITTSSALVTVLAEQLGYDIKTAIDHKRIHHQLLPENVMIENGFPQHVIDGLKSKGHKVKMSSGAGSVVQGILQREEGTITANSDFRKYGYPDGY